VEQVHSAGVHAYAQQFKALLGLLIRAVASVYVNCVRPNPECAAKLAVNPAGENLPVELAQLLL
jgi:hypothetical protein